MRLAQKLLLQIIFDVELPFDVSKRLEVSFVSYNILWTALKKVEWIFCLGRCISCAEGIKASHASGNHKNKAVLLQAYIVVSV